jgi:hypothetical protein
MILIAGPSVAGATRGQGGCGSLRDIAVAPGGAIPAPIPHPGTGVPWRQGREELGPVHARPPLLPIGQQERVRRVIGVAKAGPERSPTIVRSNSASPRA